MTARKFRWLAVGLMASLLMAGCASAPRYTSGKKTPRKKPATSRRIPPPAKRLPSVRLPPGTVLTGVSSFYGPDFHGKLTANGEVYDMYGLTAAHRTLPLNTIIRVMNLANGRHLIVRINDRGPYIEGRMLDLSYGAALKLGFIGQGTTRVRIEIIELGDDVYMKHLPENP
ncbi:MAG: septal ring lytic transglycosylase RlpA family protein [Candidatus Marinimicrobia bacterium]|nr:septal ring lytic transglycosylase RlpA family protein [Candidatus Neomarinimicrobiota bacterium]